MTDIMKLETSLLRVQVDLNFWEDRSKREQELFLLEYTRLFDEMNAPLGCLQIKMIYFIRRNIIDMVFLPSKGMNDSKITIIGKKKSVNIDE